MSWGAEISMTIKYNKPKNTKNRLIFPRGPRDLQRRQQQADVGGSQTELLEALRAQINLLQEQLNSSAVADEKLNDEVSAIIKEETAKHKKRINQLENENEVLKAKIENSDILIGQLKQIKTSTVAEQEFKQDRPRIKESFIDPIENDFEGVESNIKIEQLTLKESTTTSNKVNKLKKLLGKV